MEQYRIDGQPVFYKRFFEKNVISIRQLGLSQSNLDSLDTIKNVTSLKCNFLQWASLRSAIPEGIRKIMSAILKSWGSITTILSLMQVKVEANIILTCLFN